MSRHCWILAVLALAAIARPATAGSWTYSASVYAWLPDTTTKVDTRYGSISTELSAADALDALDLGFMGTASASSGPWTLVGDLLHLDLTLEDPTPLGQLFSEVQTRTRLTVMSAYGLHEVIGSGAVSLDVGAGLRLAASDLDVTLRGIGRPDVVQGMNDTWVDPVLVLRARAGWGKWGTTLWFDGGGFGIGDGSDATWQVVGLASYEFNDRWSLSGGYRYLEFDRTNQSSPYNLKISGPVLGVSYRF